MGASEPTYSTQPVAAGAPRVRNGLGVAALVIGVASLVAGLSFVLFPLALIGGIVGLVIAIVALAGGKSRGATDLSVQLGSWAARNSSVFTRFDKCIAQAHSRPAVANCISQFANEVRR